MTLTFYHSAVCKFVIFFPINMIETNCIVDAVAFSFGVFDCSERSSVQYSMYLGTAITALMSELFPLDPKRERKIECPTSTD